MLIEKPGIDRIQLPPSMQKVEPTVSTSKDISTQHASLLINNIYPSNVHTQVTKILKGEKEPPPSFIPNRLKWMITSLFESLGVTEETMKQYVKDSHDRRGLELKHSCLVGVADPTGALPLGSIFVTGVLGTDADLSELFVTRFPCTQPEDGLMLPLVNSKPDQMTKADWTFLCGLPFGSIIFGNAIPGEPSMPSICSCGDLDGDNYFVCWKKYLLHQIEPAEPADGAFDDGIMKTCLRNSAWLSNAQANLVDSSRMVGICGLIGKLCGIRKNLVHDCGNECPDAKALGEAYKDSLEVAKHGTKVRLPRHLWHLFPLDLHSLLGDVDAKACPHSDYVSRHKVSNKKVPQSKASTKKSRARNDDATPQYDLTKLKEGAPVEITGGSYQTQTASFVILTAKMV